MDYMIIVSFHTPIPFDGTPDPRSDRICEMLEEYGFACVGAGEGLEVDRELQFSRNQVLDQGSLEALSIEAELLALGYVHDAQVEVYDEDNEPTGDSFYLLAEPADR